MTPGALLLTIALANPTQVEPDASTARTRPQKIQRAGVGLMGGGGALMVIGAGVLVPLSLSMAARAQPPDPEDYTAVEPFEWDLYRYQVKVHRAARIGLAGAVTSVVGATTFVVGAVVWGVGRRKARRGQFSVLPSRNGLDASFRLRF